MTKVRKNITQNPSIVALAESIMAVRHFDDYSSFLEQLIREEAERRGVMHDRPPIAPITAEPPSTPVQYSKAKRAKKPRFHVRDVTGDSSGT